MQIYLMHCIWRPWIDNRGLALSNHFYLRLAGARDNATIHYHHGCSTYRDTMYPSRSADKYLLATPSHSQYSTVLPPAETKRAPASLLGWMALAVVASVALVALVDPIMYQDAVAGATTSLMAHVSPILSGTNGIRPVQTHTVPRGPAAAFNQGVYSRPLLRTESRHSTTTLHNFPATEPEAPQEPGTSTKGVRQMAGVALGAVVAVALTMFNRLRPSKETKPAAVFHVGPVNSTGAAVMDPPAPAADRPANNNSRSSGVVTPEEAVDLPFTASELYAAIPERCFKKSLFWGLFYCFRDWGIVAALYYFQPAFFGLGLAGKLLWWNITGFYGWCLFVVGHDCGHGTFSNYGWVNQLFGHICHAPLMVPFNGWRISHRHHHQYHNDVDRDHSWRPSVAKNVDRLSTPIKWFRFSPLILLVYPFYLLSPSQENGFSGNHFWPWNPLFKKEERVGIAASALSVVAWAGVIAAATAHFGFWAVFQNYWIPYWIFVAWLDLVTLMQHTDDNVLYFRGKAWNYLRGAMSTVDRTYRHIIDPFNLGYGRVIDHLHHNISDGHVIHHIFFTQIPHYRLMEATEALKPMLGKHYRFDDTPVPSAFMRTLKNCWYVEDEGGVVAYKGKPEFKGWEKANMA